MERTQKVVASIVRKGGGSGGSRMKPRSSMYVAVGSLLCAFLVALVGVAGARADDGSVPADVQRWFETSAATIVADDSEELAAGGGEGELARVSVGTPVALLRPVPDKDVDEWGESGEWAAALLRDDIVAGVVVAWHGPSTGVAELAYFDDSTPGGEAVAAAGRDPGLRVGVDPLGHGKLLVDLSAQRVTLVELGGESMTIADYRTSLADRIAESEGQAVWASPDVIGVAIIVTAALAAAGLQATRALAGRRRGRGESGR